MKQVYITAFDLILLPIYLTLIIFIAKRIQSKNVQLKPYYKYYTRGLIVKLLGGIGVCMIYVFYYNSGGDTLNYFDSDLVMMRLLVKDPAAFVSIVFFGDNSELQYASFDHSTGAPLYWGDKNSLFVVRLTCLLLPFSFNSYLLTTILLAWISYSGIWRLFSLFSEEYPEITNKFAIAVLFIPSVAFWGSGLLKDTITLSAVGWFSYSFYKAFIKKERFVRNLIFILISFYLIISIKPYILYALLLACSVWLVTVQLSALESNVLRFVWGPVMLLLVLVGAYFLVSNIGQNFGKFSVDEILQNAVITKEDLVKDYYGGYTYDIGKFEANIPSILGKAHLAISSGLFRPFLWEARNPVMLVSALETTFSVMLLIVILIKYNIFSTISLVRKNHMLLFSFVFFVFFAFAVGLTTPNFGSLVRYRIPATPFFFSFLFVLKYLYDRERKSGVREV